jgi:Kef-type K+ transport system membrane component KefB
MTDLEALVCLLLLFMGVPDLARKASRPALTYPAFVLIGILLQPFLDRGVKELLFEAGALGFLLLLFEVGLEIELPNWRQLRRPLAIALGWMALQYPAILLVGRVTGLTLAQSLVACAGLTACSVGMAHAAWKNHLGMDDTQRRVLLHLMVLLEVIAIVVLSAEISALRRGFHPLLVLQFAGIGLLIYLISRFAPRLQGLFLQVLERAVHWRIHLVILLVLAVCAVGERLGLAGAKTAFFLGLFMSRIQHHGMGLEQYLAPISQRLLIPMFFVSLGLRIPWETVPSWTGLLAFGTAGLLMGLRWFFARRLVTLGSRPDTFLILCPNLTIVALAAESLLLAGAPREVTAWLALTGLFLTVLPLLMLPGVPRLAPPDQSRSELSSPAMDGLPGGPA